MLDNRLGFSIAVGGPDTYKTATMESEGAIVYGESDIPDIPQNGRGGYEFKLSKMGMMINYASNG